MYVCALRVHAEYARTSTIDPFEPRRLCFFWLVLANLDQPYNVTAMHRTGTGPSPDPAPIAIGEVRMRCG
jgi:hypothetical protein